MATSVPTDVIDENRAATNLAAAREALGGIKVDVIIAGALNAGRVLGREELMPLQAFAKMLMANFVDSFNVAKVAANLMDHNTSGEIGERGDIIIPAPISAYASQLGLAAYLASKDGVTAMATQAAREFDHIVDAT